MLSSRRSALHFGAAAIVGVLIGFILPHPPVADAADDGAAQPMIAGDDADMSSCKCEQQICSSPDGLRNVIGQCAVRCHDGKTAECVCGKCTEEGHVDKPSACRCKSAE